MEGEQILIPEKQVNTSVFTSKIEQTLLDEPEKFQTTSENYRYLSGSASFFYEQKSCEEVIRSLQDPLSFFSEAEEFFSSRQVTPESVKNFIFELNKTLIKKNFFTLDVENPDEDKFHFEINGQKNTVIKPIPKGAYGVHSDNTETIMEYEGDFLNPTRVITMSEKADSTSLVFINGNLLRENPGRALITLAHELGHGVEKKYSPPTTVTIDNTTYNEVIPDTEAISTAWGTKMAEVLWKKTADPKYIEYGARQFNLNKHVTQPSAKTSP